MWPRKDLLFIISNSDTQNENKEREKEILFSIEDIIILTKKFQVYFFFSCILETMSTSTNTSLAEAVYNINWSGIIFLEVWCIVTFLLGSIGHALNFYVFTRHELRSNPCTCYFLASTVAGCGVVYGAIPLRFLQTVYDIDTFTYSLPSCKILTYLLNCFRQVVLKYMEIITKY